MNTSLVFLLVITMIMLLINKNKFGTYYSSFFFVVLPYTIIIFINNVIMCKRGFYPISEKTIYIISLGEFLFFLGTLVGRIRKKNKVINNNRIKESQVVNSTLIAFTIISCGIVFVDLLMCIRRYGLGNYISGGELYARGQIAEHFRLVLVILSILLIEEYLKKKKLYHMFLLICSLGLIFSSFIKYHIIATFLSIIIYFALVHREYLKKIGVVFGSLIIVSFILTYVITFKSYNASVTNTFYGNHLWGYIAGGILNIDNGTTFFSMRRTDLSFVLWIVEMITSFPSMITNKLFGFSFTDYIFCQKTIEFNLGASSSNVICIPGAAYIQGGLICFAIFVFVAGMIIEYVFCKAKRTVSMSRLVATSVFLSYCMLSFFASFFELSAPWETMLLSFVVVEITKIKFVVRH